MTAPARIEPQLEFFAEAHEYRLDGQRVPSVTQILSWNTDTSRIPAWTAHRGTALHLAAQFLDEGDLDWDSVDPIVLPHLERYRDFRDTQKPEYEAIELPVWGEIDGLRFAGMIDRVRVLRSHRRVTDLKSGKPRAEHGAQVQAYKVALQQRFGYDDVGCSGLYLPNDGPWVEKQYNEPHHLETFRAKLRRYYAEARNVG